jgi:hypothetical protein
MQCAATSKHYIVSCAHVMGPQGPPVYTPGPHEHRGSKVLGTVRFSAVPDLKMLGQACNAKAQPYDGRVDLSIAEWDPEASLRNQITPKAKVNGVRSTDRITDYDLVQLAGKESGLVKAQVSGTTLWKVIDFGDFGAGPAGARCFGSIFQLTDFEGGRDQLVEEGDSGAWIVDRVGDLSMLNGMLIAHQGNVAYGCYAEFMLDTLRTCPECPGGLSVGW